MSETEQNPKSTEETAASKAAEEETKSAADQAEQDEFDDEEYDDEPMGGFDPEQKRFLWTLTGVLVLGMLLSTAANIWVRDQTHRSDMQIAALTDDFREKQDTASKQFNPLFMKMLDAMVAGRGDVVQAIENKLVSLQADELTARAMMRRAKGLDGEPPTIDDLADFGRQIMGKAKQELANAGAQMRSTSRPTSGPSTQPGAQSQPATTTEAITAPIPAPAGPSTGPAVGPANP